MDIPRARRNLPLLRLRRLALTGVVLVAVVFGVASLPVAFLYFSGATAERSEPLRMGPTSADAQLPGAAAIPDAQAPPRRDVAFIGVTVVPMDADRLVPDQTVIVRDGRIRAIAPRASTPVPDGVDPIDGAGRYLMPGLVDMHVHLRAGAAPAMLRLFVATGVTTVLNMSGTPAHLALRGRVARGELLGPAIFTSGPFISHAPFWTPSAQEAEAAVVRQARAGYDLIKIHGDFTRDAYARAIAAARRVGLRVVGHAPRNLGIGVAYEEGQDALAHVEEYIYAWFRFGADRSGVPADVEEKIRRAAEDTAAAGVQVIANLSAYRGIARQAQDVAPLLARPEMKYVPGAIVADWMPERNDYVRRFSGQHQIFFEWYRVLERLTGALARAGVPIMAGSDTPIPCVVPGFSLRDELRDLVAAGLTPYQALAAATTTPAAFLKRATQLGPLRVGRRADLLLVDADPLADVGNVAKVAGVMVDGRWLDGRTIARLLDELALAATGS